MTVSNAATLSSIFDVLKASNLRSTLSVVNATSLKSNTQDVLKAATLNSTELDVSGDVIMRQAYF